MICLDKWTLISNVHSGVFAPPPRPIHFVVRLQKSLCTIRYNYPKIGRNTNRTKGWSYLPPHNICSLRCYDYFFRKIATDRFREETAKSKLETMMLLNRYLNHFELLCYWKVVLWEFLAGNFENVLLSEFLLVFCLDF